MHLYPTNADKQEFMSRLASTALLTLVCAAGWAAPIYGAVAQGRSTIDIRSERVAPDPAAWLLGVHSLWWGMDGEYLRNGQLAPAILGLLRASHSIVRYGGAANEADWTLCGADANQRVAAKVVSWSGPLRCNFGWQEYVDNVLARRRGSVWLIANVVGNEAGEYADATLVGHLGAAATRLRTLAPEADRIWELGNELERGKVRWEPAKMAARLQLAAEALRRADPQARAVFPLTEFDPSPRWKRKSFNEVLLESVGTSFSDYAIHQYYEGAPGGPRVSTQLMVLRETAKQIERHASKQAGLWVTEHGRWPAGTPSDAHWRDNWWLTNSMSGVLATADYLIGLSQIGMVRGAMLHGLRAGPWNVVDTGPEGVRLTGVGQLLSNFGISGATYRLRTSGSAPDFPSDWDAYRGRVAAFETEREGEFVIWGVNKSAQPFSARLQFNGQPRVLEALQARVLSCPRSLSECRSDEIVVTDPPAGAMLQSAAGQSQLSLPPASVFVLRYRLRP